MGLFLFCGSCVLWRVFFLGFGFRRGRSLSGVQVDRWDVSFVTSLSRGGVAFRAIGNPVATVTAGYSGRPVRGVSSSPDWEGVFARGIPRGKSVVPWGRVG